ncbi:MAG: M56 family metallopeptidase, partial [Planctomycetaceae bacterium]
MNDLPINSFVEALGWTLVHSVWQGAVIAAALWCVLRAARQASDQVRYAAACAALFAMMVAGLATFVRGFDPKQDSNSPVAATPSSALARESVAFAADEGAGDAMSLAPIAMPTTLVQPDDVSPDTRRGAFGLSALASTVRPWLSWIVVLWSCGVTFHSLRLFVGWRAIRALRRTAWDLEHPLWMGRFAALRSQLGVSSRVRLLASAEAVVPMVIGWLKPVVLIPASLFTGLSRSEVEAILVHELMHIRRYDGLVNLIQSVLESLLFYHPAVWWVSAQIRQEREHCCDAAAAAWCGSTLEYARALAALEALRSAPPALSVAAGGGSLLRRIQRLTRETRDEGRAASPLGMLSVLTIAAAVMAIVMLRTGQVAATTDGAIESAAAALLVVEEQSERPSAELAQADGENPQPNDRAGTDPTPQQPAAIAPAKKLNVRGTVVDDVTGAPVGPVVIQRGIIDPKDPTKVVWGFQETRSNRPGDNTFSINTNTNDAWLNRILADGYLPEPVATPDLQVDGQLLEVTVRLKRGRRVDGRVLDHTGQPIAGMPVFAVGPHGLNLAGGNAWRLPLRGFANEFANAMDEKDRAARPVLTDEQGRFTIHAGAATSLAVSSAALEIWPVAIAAAGEVVIELPAPATLEIVYDIEGGDPECMIMPQLTSPEFDSHKVRWAAEMLRVKNGDRVVLKSLPPGEYRVSRCQETRIGRRGKHAYIDGQVVQLPAGEMKSVRFVRDRGARIRGRVVTPAGTNLEAVAVSVMSEEPVESSFPFRGMRMTYAMHRVGDDGSFHTERILPGRYVLVAEAFEPQFNPLGGGGFPFGGGGGLFGPKPDFRAEVPVAVPESGELTVPDIVLKEASEDTPASKTTDVDDVSKDVLPAVEEHSDEAPTAPAQATGDKSQPKEEDQPNEALQPPAANAPARKLGIRGTVVDDVTGA